MLHASLEGKVSVNAGLGDNQHVTHFNEDSLTSTVFGLLSYLPGKHAWSLLHECIPGLPAFKVGWLKGAEFWPAWNPKGNNINRTEPDAYLRFVMGDPEQVIDVIVEAKRAPSAHQDVSQWRYQLESYKETVFDEDVEPPDRVFYLALSGLASGKELLRHSFGACPDFDMPVEIVFCDWTDISKAAQKQRDESEPHTARLLSMMVQGLAHAGFVERLFFDSLKQPPTIPFSQLIVSPKS